MTKKSSICFSWPWNLGPQCWPSTLCYSYFFPFTKTFIKLFFSILKYQCGRIISTAISRYRTGNLPIKFSLTNMQKSFKNTKKGVLLLSEIHHKHRKHIPIPIINVYAPTTHQMNINTSNLFWSNCLTYFSSFMYY